MRARRTASKTIISALAWDIFDIEHSTFQLETADRRRDVMSPTPLLAS